MKKLINALLLTSALTLTGISVNKYIESNKTHKEFMERYENLKTQKKDKYTKIKAFANNDSIPDFNIYKNGTLHETWYGPYNMTKEEIYKTAHTGEKWGLEPKVDSTILKLYKKL